ncbi:MAG: ATP-binding protein [Anaerolineae bacterium]
MQEKYLEALAPPEADLAGMVCETLCDVTPAGFNFSSPDTIAAQRSLRAVLALLRRAVVAEWSAEAEAAGPEAISLPDLLEHVEATADRLWSGLEAALVEMAVQRNRFEAVAQIGKDLISSYDLEHSLQVAIGLAEVLQVDQAALMVLDHESGNLFTWANCNLDLPPLALAALPSEWQRGWGTHLTLPDPNGDYGWLEELLGPDYRQAVAAVPLNAGGSLYGLFLLLRPVSKPFNEEELNLILTIAGITASLVSNAEVYRLINTQALQLGEMLREQQNESSKNRAILRSIADGVIVNDHRGKIVLINPAAEQIVGLVKSGPAGLDIQALLETFEANGRDNALAALAQILAHPQHARSGGLTAMLALDQRVVSARMAPVFTPHDEFLGVVTILRDVTKEVEADRAKSEFVSNVSHELRTPMTAIKGYTDLIYAGAVGPINDEQRRFLGIIKSNTDRLTALINDLLDISRIETGRVRFEPGPLQIGEIVTDVVEAMMGRAREKKHALTYTIAENLPQIQGDRDRLVQVLTNLVGNAINYTPDGGAISLEVSATDGAVQVDVSDTGVGIPAEDLGKVFDRFYRGEHDVVLQSPGTGLGLSIVRMFVEMHGGRMWVRSEEGRGSTFTFILPATGREIPGLTEAGPPASAGHSILVADGDPAAAELLMVLLENQGYRVTLAARGGQVLDAARKETPDLILLDTKLSDGNGLDVLAELKRDAATRTIPVLVASVFDDDGLAARLGAVGYVSKPIEDATLLEQIEAALGDRVSVPLG